MTLLPGTRLGPYEILAPIGAGGMGEVYRARDPRLSRGVAIKVLPAAFEFDTDRRSRFETEARSASAGYGRRPRRKMVLLPLGAGKPRPLPREKVKVRAAAFLPDGKRIVFGATEPGHGERIYIRDLSSGPSRAISPEGYRGLYRVVSRDGSTIPTRGPDGRFYLYPLSGGEPTRLPGMSAGEFASGWAADGRLLVYRRGQPADVHLVDVRTGGRELWRSFMPADTAGVADVGPIVATPDRTTYVYSYARTLSDLYVVEGLR